MHAVSQCLSHRGPGATRARARWQPYSSLALSGSNTPSRTSSPFSYLPTPSSSVCSSPPSIQTHAVCDTESIKPQYARHVSRVGSLREAQKVRHVTGLIDKAIRSLCDTWRADIIPPAFANSPTPPPDSSPPLDSRPHSEDILQSFQQLPSPISPSTRPTAFPAYYEPRSADSATDTAPIKGFVHEVLRRSKTSVGVLQTALCYLEAVRTRLPDVLRKDRERMMAGHSGAEEETYLDRITVQNVTEGSACDDCTEASFDAASTLRVSGDADSVVDSPSFGPVAAVVPTECATSETKQDAVLPPLPPQPSPLLCPRRTFLACLILASKFMQDRSYSNRAWAKLAGLPPREIGRCERAVGNVLEWRLWVGKDPNAGSRHGRSLLRSRSDGDV
ncbi:hypothetical protein C8Q72DRAFT_780425, partial [Fomitopsis betulina]